MTNWEDHSDVSPGTATRLFDAANGVLAREPGGSRAWCVDVHTEATETNTNGDTFRVFLNGSVQTGPSDEIPNSPDQVRKPPPVTPAETGTAVGARQVARDLLLQLADDFQLVGTTALTQPRGAASTMGIACKYIGGHAYEVAEILKDLAERM